MTITTLNGTKLFYQEIGAGLPCLVMHGGLGLDHTYLRAGLDPLSSQLRLIFYDQRGNGRSERLSCDTLTFDQLCADADALRALLGIDRVAILGHSAGGFIALEYALRCPQKVSHLILVDTAPSFDYGAEIMENVQRKPPSSETLAALAAPPPATDEEFEQGWQAILPLYFHRYDPEVATRAFAQSIYSAAAVRCSDALFASYNVASRLSEIQAHTLIIVGDDDFICPPSQASRLRLGIPYAKQATLSACGHFPFIECQAAFTTAVQSWLAQVT